MYWLDLDQLNPQPSLPPNLLQFLDIAFQGGDARLQGRDRGGEFPQLDEGLGGRCDSRPTKMEELRRLFFEV